MIDAKTLKHLAKASEEIKKAMEANKESLDANIRALPEEKRSEFRQIQKDIEKAARSRDVKALKDLQTKLRNLAQTHKPDGSASS